MNPEDIGRILDEVGERIGPAGEYAWQISVRAQATAGAIGLAVSIAGICLIVAALVWIWKVAEDADSTDTGMIRVLSITIGFFALLALVVVLHDSAIRALTPEFHALKALIGAVK